MTTPPTLISHLAVVDGTGAPRREEQSIVVDAGRIAWIGPTPAVPASWRATTRELDASGATAIPGLFDCHTHLTFDADPASFESLPTSPVALTLLAERNLEAQLRSGVTTVRDCGSIGRLAIDLRDAVARGELRGPRIQAAGLVLTMTGGHGHFIGNPVDGADSGTRAARTELAAGADFIKAMASGGVLTKGVSTGQIGLQREELAAIVRAAHDAGRRVTAHATGLGGAENAIEAGVDSVEHGMELTEGLAARAAELGTTLVPTLSAVDGLRRERGALPGWMAEKVDPAVANLTRSFALAVAAGVTIATGTDAGTPFNPHGGLGGELELLVAAGLTPMEAIIAATRSSAANLGLAAELGTLEVGKLADLVLLDGDPTADIAAIHTVRAVLKEGEVLVGDPATPELAPSSAR